MFMNNLARNGATGEARLSPNAVRDLTTRLKVLTGGPIASSAAIVDGIAYVGSWDGNEYSIDLATGAIRWKIFLGQTINEKCFPSTLGVTSSAAVVDGVVYVGGGNTFWYALEAATGKVLWRVATGDNAPTMEGGHYNWSSPLIWGGAAYIGIASACDNPSIRGQLLRVDLKTHKVTATLQVVAEGQRGGGIWTSPAVDPATKTIFVTTGETTVPGQPVAQSMVALDATTLAVRSRWQVPAKEAVAADSDWGTSPILFSDASGRDLVAGGNKNGTLYAFVRSDVAAGPIWRTKIAKSGQCAVCAEGTVSSMTFGQGLLFAAGGATTIAGTDYKGSVRALDPATGKPVWEKGFPDPVIAALAYDNGFVVVAVGPTLAILGATDGELLFSAPAAVGTFSAPSISGGEIVLGLLDGNVWVLAPK
jgi:polyvinyl alcohol dehydrogenase (cytochrome)